MTVTTGGVGARVVSIEVLGPMRATVARRQIRLSTQAQALLGALALARPVPVPADHLAMIGGAGSPLTRRALQTAIWRLRQRLANGAVEATGDGYRLGDDVVVDRDLFLAEIAAGEEALGRSDHREAAALLGRALERWRGAPELGSDDRLALVERHAAAVESWAAALVGSGAEAEAVDALAALVATNPDRQRAWSLLLDAERAAGSPGALRRAREALDHVAAGGLIPSPALAASAARILGPEPSGGRSQLPPWLDGSRADDVFVGRGGAVDALLQALDESASGSTRSVVVTGEPGAGKTRLAAEIAAVAAGRGIRVWAGRWDRHQVVPYRAELEALEGLLADAPVDAAQRVLAGPLGSLIGSAEAGNPALLASESRRLNLFEDLAALVASCVRDQPGLLILDDLHWAQRDSLLSVRHLLRSHPRMAACVVLTVRQLDQVPADHKELLDELLADSSCRLVTLGGLAHREVMALPRVASLAATGDPSAAELAGRLVRATGGNPLLLRRLIEDPDHVQRLRRVEVEAADVGVSSVPPRLRAVVAAHVSGLTAPSRAALGAAALLGLTFDPSVLVRALGSDAEEALVEGQKAGLLRRDGHLWSFVHDLVGEGLAAGLDASARATTHARLADTLETVADPDRAADLYAIAHHVARAGASVTPDRARQAALAAGDLAASQMSFGLASRSYATAAAHSPAAEAVDLLLRAAEWARLDGDAERARSLLAEAEGQSRADGRPRLLALVAAAAGDLAIRAEGPLGPEVRALALEARGRIDPHVDEELDARLAFLVALATGPGSLPPVVDGIPAGAQRRRLAARGLLVGHHADRHPLSRLLDPSSVDPAEAATAEIWRWVIDLEAGDATLLDPVREERLHRSLSELESTEAPDGPELKWSALVWSATRLISGGRFGEGQAAMEAAFRLARQAPPGDWPARAAAIHRTQGGLLRFYTGWGGEEEDVLPVTPMWTRSARTWRQTLAFALARAGSPESARAPFEEACDQALEVPGQGGGWLGQLGILAGTAHAVGDRARAERLIEAMRPHSGQHGVCSVDTYTGAVDHQIGLLLQLLGDLDAAVEAFRKAVDAHVAIGAVPFATLSRMQLTVSLDRRGRSDDRQEILALASQARGAGAELGMPRVSSVLASVTS